MVTVKVQGGSQRLGEAEGEATGLASQTPGFQSPF